MLGPAPSMNDRGYVKSGSRSCWDVTIPPQMTTVQYLSQPARYRASPWTSHCIRPLIVKSRGGRRSTGPFGS